MTRKLSLLAITVLLTVAADSQAQYPLAGGYAPYPPSGFGFHYHSGRFRIAGYFPYGPGVIVAPPVVGVIERRIIVQPVVPVPVQPQYDLSGIDLDIESPDKLYPPGSAPARPPVRLGEPQLPPPPVAKLPPPPAKLPPPMPEKLPPAPPLPAPKKPEIEDLWQPQPGAAGESRRLAELGRRAFRAGEYGTALWRFRQASEVDPTHARAFFLMAQAQIAVGQFHATLAPLQEGLNLQPDWPTSDFRPRLELYGDNVEDWLESRRRLDDALKRKPDDAVLLFLRGYVAWFDGQRPQAVEWFMKARAVTADPRYIDLFLKHAPAPAVAAS
jgi:hypothetical protein